VKEREAPLAVDEVEAEKPRIGATPDGAGAIFTDDVDGAGVGCFIGVINDEPLGDARRRRLGVEAAQALAGGDPVDAAAAFQKVVDVAARQALRGSGIDEAVDAEWRQSLPCGKP